ncbi:MAG TPA: TlpA disulfide reductase family protein [Burkholderiales bacterium]
MAPGRRDALILGAVALGAAAVGGVVGALALQARSGAADLLASRFPDLAGQSRQLLEWQGRSLVCNFWATWCAPCREEIPLLNAAQHKYVDKGIQVVGIAIDNAANVSEFGKSVKIAYPVLLAGSAAIELMRSLGNASGGLPFTVLLDRRGRLVGRKLGAFSAADLDAAVAGLLR